MKRLDLVAACVAATGMAVAVRAQEPDWSSMSWTPHSVYQSVDSSGNGTFATDHPIKMRGILLNWPTTMLNTTPGSDPFMGGQWQRFIQATDADGFGGTAMWMGQNVGKIMGSHPAGSYTDEQWQAELDRLNHNPVTGRLFRPGDLVEVRARAPGLFYNGKTNVNEQHTNDPAADFDIVLLQEAYSSLTPQTITLADVKDASDQFIFDATRATGAEHYQGELIEIQNVQFAAGTWGPGRQMTITDGAGHTLPLLLGIGSGFSLYGPPASVFDVVGIFDQEDGNGADGYKAGYRLWAMDYDGTQFVLYRYVKPDFDRDGDVDGSDLDHFEACASGPGITQTDPPCLSADFDGDADVDQSDFGTLQRCLSGSDELPDPQCDQ